MSPYDFMMLVVLVGAAIWGGHKGMAGQIASIASLVLNYYVAWRFSDQLAPYFGEQAPFNRYASMLTLYLATSAGIWFALQFVKSAIESVQLKEFDRQVGALFGAAKGALLCVLITFFAVMLSEPAREAVRKSYSGKYITLALHNAGPLLPKDAHEALEPYIRKFDEKLGAPSRDEEEFDEGSSDGWGDLEEDADEFRSEREERGGSRRGRAIQDLGDTVSEFGRSLEDAQQGFDELTDDVGDWRDEAEETGREAIDRVRSGVENQWEDATRQAEDFFRNSGASRGGEQNRTARPASLGSRRPRVNPPAENTESDPVWRPRR